jgi:pimeloyl-ACP methyl ester carboxylesterase
MIASVSSFLTLRGLNCHLRQWGHPDGRPLLLLHGWMDNSASFQFLADALGPGWHLIAPDWRGFGLSEWAPGGSYAYTDYLADLDALVDALKLKPTFDLLGHSLGGYIASMYAAARPRRVARLINVEGMGLRAREGAEAPEYLSAWLDEVKASRMPKTYPDFDDLSRRILQNNPWLDEGRADFVARHWATETCPAWSPCWPTRGTTTACPTCSGSTRRARCGARSPARCCGSRPRNRATWSATTSRPRG